MGQETLSELQNSTKNQISAYKNYATCYYYLPCLEKFASVYLLIYLFVNIVVT